VATILLRGEIMQPYYQKAAEAQREREEYPLNLAKNLGSAALGAGAARLGYSALGTILPKIQALISPKVPDAFSIGGLNKVDPRLGKFIDGALKEGYSYDDIKGFLGEKVQKSEQKEEEQKARKKGNIIEQYDPELHIYISEKLKNGEGLYYAGRKALDHPRFKKAVDKITKDHKASWTDILKAVYGEVFKNKEQEMNQQRSPNAPAAQAAPQQPGPGEGELMQTLQQILAIRGGGPKQ